jgi:engulfment/cell motility protein 1
VSEVIQQLCSNIKIQEPSTFFALRDENDELVTDENLRKKIRSKSPLR